MKNIFDVAEGNRPIFGSMSIIAPGIGVLGLLVIMGSHGKDTAGFGGLFVALGFLFMTIVIGLVCSIIGISRRERLKGLSILGLIINGLPTLFALDRIFQ